MIPHLSIKLFDILLTSSLDVLLYDRLFPFCSTITSRSGFRFPVYRGYTSASSCSYTISTTARHKIGRLREKHLQFGVWGYRPVSGLEKGRVPSKTTPPPHHPTYDRQYPTDLSYQFELPISRDESHPRQRNFHFRHSRHIGKITVNKVLLPIVDGDTQHQAKFDPFSTPIAAMSKQKVLLLGTIDL